MMIQGGGAGQPAQSFACNTHAIASLHSMLLETLGSMQNEWRQPVAKAAPPEYMCTMKKVTRHHIQNVSQNQYQKVSQS